MIVLGVDEAGRGPIIGPLVIVGCTIEENKQEVLKNIGVKDSKLLTHKKRIELSKEIKKLVKGYEIIIIPPQEIDQHLETDGTNLNWLEANKTIEIINILNPDKAIIDCPSPNLRAYKEYLLERINNKSINLITEHNAEKNPIVAAASVLAKVVREEEIETLKKKYGDFGPGYMSNLTTQKYLKENWEKHPEIFRKSWSPYKNYKNHKNQKKIDEF